jgi:hypothetical protein
MTLIKLRGMRLADIAARMGRRGVELGVRLMNRMKETPGRSRHRWKDNIRTGHAEVVFGGKDWINVA